MKINSSNVNNVSNNNRKNKYMSKYKEYVKTKIKQNQKIENKVTNMNVNINNINLVNPNHFNENNNPVVMNHINIANIQNIQNIQSGGKASSSPFSGVHQRRLNHQRPLPPPPSPR